MLLPTNALLAALPRKTLIEIKPHLVPVALAFGQVLYQSPLRWVVILAPLAAVFFLTVSGEGHDPGIL